MPDLLPNIDPDRLLKYSVVFTERSLNYISKKCQGMMNDFSSTIKEVYNADAVAPSGRTYLGNYWAWKL